jgi:hypothetical protein
MYVALKSHFVLRSNETLKDVVAEVYIGIGRYVVIQGRGRQPHSKVVLFVCVLTSIMKACSLSVSMEESKAIVDRILTMNE